LAFGRTAKYLSTSQLASLIAACDGSLPQRRRDRAILLLLARLGLRAGDVAQLRIANNEWETRTLRVISLGYFRPLSSQCRVR
jgi:integrase